MLGPGSQQSRKGGNQMTLTNAQRLAAEIERLTPGTKTQILDMDGHCAVAYFTGSTWLTMNEVPPATLLRWQREDRRKQQHLHDPLCYRYGVLACKEAK
jgi:hypothetical protein